MSNLIEIPTYDSDGAVHVVIESPRGARVKLKYRPELGAFGLSRPLPVGLAYPFDWGFVPHTRSPDGDPLDAMVIFDAPTWPGVVLPCRVIGVARVTQRSEQHSGREPNDRLIALPEKAPRADGITDVLRLPQRLRDELAQFFVASGALDGKEAAVDGWEGPAAGLSLVAEAARAFR